jgi:hypothetical protein
MILMQSVHASLARKFLENYPHLPACQGQCFAKFRQLATQKKPSATSKKGIFKKNFQKIRHIS